MSNNYIELLEYRPFSTKEYIRVCNKCPEPNSDNPYHIPYEGEQEDYNYIVEFNKALVQRYPWLMPKDRVGDDTYNYQYTELDSMPDGWRLAFGDKMCNEIQSVLEKFNLVDKYSITEIKEKYGILTWYDFLEDNCGCYGNLTDIICKYKNKSRDVCISCGKPVKYMSKGWISYYCEDCVNKDYEAYRNHIKAGPVMDKDEYINAYYTKVWE